MKKLFSILAIFLFALAATFAQSAGDKIISVENFNEPWIIGTWTLEVQIVGIGQNASKTITVEFTGCNDPSVVKETDADGKDAAETLKQIKDAFSQILELGNMFKQLESNGAEITGSQNLYVNEAKTKVFYNIGVSFQGETAAIRLVMQKQ